MIRNAEHKKANKPWFTRWALAFTEKPRILIGRPTYSTRTP